MSLRIAHILSSFGMGGQERVALELAKSHFGDGHHVIAIALEPPPGGALLGSFEGEGVTCFCLGSRATGIDPLLFPRLLRTLREERIDIVHTHNPAPLIYAPLASRLAGARVVHTKHGKNPSSRGNWLLRRFNTPLLSSFVCVSSITKSQALSQRECGQVGPTVIENGISVERFRLDLRERMSFRSELGISPGAFVFGTVGRLDRNKNQQLLIRALEPLLGNDVHLVLVGDGDQREALDKIAREIEVDPWVHLTGLRRDVPRALSAFDVFVLCSTSEGLPLVIPEAMAAELPIISTDVGGISVVVQSGETGLLVAPGDVLALREACAEVMRRPGLRQRLGTHARERAESGYSVHVMADRYMKVYQRAITPRLRT